MLLLFTLFFLLQSSNFDLQTSHFISIPVRIISSRKFASSNFFSMFLYKEIQCLFCLISFINACALSWSSQKFGAKVLASSSFTCSILLATSKISSERGDSFQKCFILFVSHIAKLLKTAYLIKCIFKMGNLIILFNRNNVKS